MNYADNVKESTTVTSAASFTPGGAATNYRSFTSAYADGASRIPVKVGPDANGAWEIGFYTLSGGGLTRNGIISSSATGNAAVTFAAGAKDVSVVYPASYAVDIENSATLTNKRISTRVSTINAPTATPAVNTDQFDRLSLTGVAVNITSVTVSGTPVVGDTLVIDMQDNGTARTFSLGASFEPSTVSIPSTTVAGQKLTMSFDWNPASSKWRLMGYA